MATTTLHPNGVMGRPYSFSPKTSAVSLANTYATGTASVFAAATGTASVFAVATGTVSILELATGTVTINP